MAFSAFYGDLTMSMLNWGDRRVKMDGIHPRHIACCVKRLGECDFKGNNILHIFYSSVMVLK